MATKASKYVSSYLLDLIRLIDAKDVQSLDTLLSMKPVSAQNLIELASSLTQSGHTQRQQDAANAKHAANKKAREFVQNLWHIDRFKYTTNIEFSRQAALKVLKKFAVEVKPETISRDWLKGIGSSRSMQTKLNARAYVDGRYISGTLHKNGIKPSK